MTRLVVCRSLIISCKHFKYTLACSTVRSHDFLSKSFRPLLPGREAVHHVLAQIRPILAIYFLSNSRGEQAIRARDSQGSAKAPVAPSRSISLDAIRKNPRDKNAAQKVIVQCQAAIFKAAFNLMMPPPHTLHPSTPFQQHSWRFFVIHEKNEKAHVDLQTFSYARSGGAQQTQPPQPEQVSQAGEGRSFEINRPQWACKSHWANAKNLELFFPSFLLSQFSHPPQCRGAYFYAPPPRLC